MNTRSIGNRRDRRAGLQAHVLQGLGGRLPVGRVGEVGRVGHRAADVGDLARVGAPGDLRLDVGRVEDLDAVVVGARRRWAAVFQRSTAASKSFGANSRPRTG